MVTRSPRHVRDRFAHQFKVVSSLAGAPFERNAGREPSAKWMLENGPRLTLSATKFGCS